MWLCYEMVRALLQYKYFKTQSRNSTNTISNMQHYFDVTEVVYICISVTYPNFCQAYTSISQSLGYRMMTHNRILVRIKNMSCRFLPILGYLVWT